MNDEYKVAIIVIVVIFSCLYGLIGLNAAGTFIMDRQVFCREQLLQPEHTKQECNYPMQKIVLEQGVSRKLLICRCP